MTDHRPDPLVPPDVDISGLDGFMLDVQRLFASELWALSTGDEFKAAVALWGRAWQQSPPGSLPNDERILAAFSGAGKDWKKVRGMALRGFVECSDSRLYHKVLCQDVMNAHRKRQAFRDRTKAATKARRQRNDKDDVQRNDVRDADRNDAPDDQRDVVEDANATSVQGQGQGQGHIETSSLRSDVAHAGEPPKGSSGKPKAPRRHAFPPDAFDRWYSDYPHKVGRAAAEKAFAKVAGSDSVAFDTLVSAVERYRRTKPADREWCNPATWLNQGRWTDEPATSLLTPTAAAHGAEPRIDFGGGVSWPETTVRNQVAYFRRDPSTWPTDRLGPPPGTLGCRVPDRLLEVAA